MTARPDPLWRRLAAFAYRLKVNAQLRGLSAVPPETAEPRLWYAGARAGAAGGPALKLAKLKAAYPQWSEGFNLVYLLSAAPYLNRAAFGRLKQAGVVSVLNQNGVFYPAWFAGDWQARNRQMAIAHELAVHVLYQSDFCRRAALKFLGPREGGFEILYNAVDTDLFTPAPEGPDHPFVFLMTGKIDAHQSYRITRAIEALEVVRRQGLSSGLILAGVLAPEVQQAAQMLIADHAMENYVLLPGPYGQAEAPHLYRSAQAYLTLTHQDACPSGVIEALASGLPVVHPSSGGVPELAGEAGVAIETGEDWEQPIIPSAQAVAEAMLKAAGARKDLSAKARARAETLFSLKHWLERHATLFHQLLERP